MTTLAQTDPTFNPQICSSDILSALDLVEVMREYHRDQCTTHSRLARWHKFQARALQAERYFLQQEIGAVLADVEEALK